MSGRLPLEVDRSVWRIVGDPLVPPTRSGPLDGWTVAVKDLFALAGHAVGAGVPVHLDTAAAETVTAAAVADLLAAGAGVRGIARTDQFAYSVAGQNPHYGTPPNAAVPGALPGGSTSGPASAVALGQADIGLGSDTAGSIRVPASYQGLWGLRTTHGAVRTEGVLPLAPSFDTVGWLTRDGATLAAVARSGLDAGAQRPADPAFVVAPELTEQAEPDVRRAFTRACATLASRGGDVTEVTVGDLHALYEHFRIVQAAEAWRAHGAWIRGHPGAVVGDVADRFAAAATVTQEQEDAARAALRAAAGALDSALGDRVLLLPAASSTAPAADASPEEVQRTRAASLRMTCVAGVTGRPALSVPAMVADGRPVGLCLVGPRGSDLALVERGRVLAAELDAA